ncbi:MAG: hypothetical protein NVS9B15_25960 [Acidobacteriaceae bacterium]
MITDNLSESGMNPIRPAALIVDDQPFAGLVASDILAESGYHTYHAYDARDAIEVLADHPEIEVLVAEAGIPGDVNGVELCRRLSKERPDVQLVVTASGPSVGGSDVPKGVRVLRKPYASGELRALVAAKRLIEAV